MMSFHHFLKHYKDAPEITLKTDYEEIQLEARMESGIQMYRWLSNEIFFDF